MFRSASGIRCRYLEEKNEKQLTLSQKIHIRTEILNPCSYSNINAGARWEKVSQKLRKYVIRFEFVFNQKNVFHHLGWGVDASITKKFMWFNVMSVWMIFLWHLSCLYTIKISPWSIWSFCHCCSWFFSCKPTTKRNSRSKARHAYSYRSTSVCGRQMCLKIHWTKWMN